MSQARKKVSEEAEEEASFDWRKRIRSSEGWYLVGQKFGADWAMVWEEILIGFTVAGFVAVLVPASYWSMIFLTHLEGTLPAWIIALQNAAVAPFVAAATFIGSMGNIPLATVLNANGVLFAGIMGFIYTARFDVLKNVVADRTTGHIWNQNANPATFPMSWAEAFEYIERA